MASALYCFIVLPRNSIVRKNTIAANPVVGRVSFSVSEVSLLKPEVSLLKPEVSLLKPEVSLLKPEVCLLKPVGGFTQTGGELTQACRPWMADDVRYGRIIEGWGRRISECRGSGVRHTVR